MKSTPHSRFRIGNLPFRFTQNLKRKLGTRNYHLICVATFAALIAAVVIPISLSTNQEESFAASNGDSEKVIDIKFLNTQTGDDLETEKYSGGAANLLTTKAGNCILIDTSVDDATVRSRIMNALNTSCKKNNKTVLEYLVVSHLDADHYSNAAYLINSVKVENVIVKYEGTLIAQKTAKKTAYDNIIKAAKSAGAHIYTNATDYEVDGQSIDSYDNYTRLFREGYNKSIIDIDANLTLYFYNTQDVYRNSSCTTGRTYKFIAKESSNFIKNSSDQYRRAVVNKNNVPELNFSNVSTLDIRNQTGGSTPVENYLNSYYYGYLSSANDSDCNSNGNSYAILAKVKYGTDNNANKFVYFPNDIENTGYGLNSVKENISYYTFNGESTSTGADYSVYGTGTTKLYASNADFFTETGKTQNKVPAESRAALEAKSRIENTNSLSDLVIYQVSHHGSNNVPDAISTLGINRADVFTIANRSGGMTAGSDIITKRARWTISQTKNFTTGKAIDYGDGIGVRCAIGNKGGYLCSYEEVNINTLSYNLNGGSGSIPNQTCLSDGNCKFIITSTTPTRSGYVFLGWANTSSATSAAYPPNYELSITGNKTLYAVWAPIYTLTYNLNGGTGEIAAETCNPSTIGGNCQVNVTSTTPAREGYKFLGWANTSSATSATISSHDIIYLDQNRTIYAIWAPTYIVTFDLNGGSGSVAAQSCNPATTNGSCNVQFPSTTPTYDGYKFLGWATSSEAINPTYYPGSVINISSNKTIYAVWQRVIDINTSVDGGNGTITPSMTNVAQGTTVTIVFSPASGYEIDTVTVNGIASTEVSNNRLTLTADDINLNIVVTYKAIPDPGPDPEPTVFHLYFSASSGEADTPSTLSCTVADPAVATPVCDVTIPSTIPTRDGYTFLGYGTYADIYTPAYHPGDTYTLTSDTYVVTVWAPIQTLNYDLNGGEGVIGAQTCSPTTANGDCSVEISNTIPTYNDYTFLGWSTDPEASTLEFSPGETFTFIATNNIQNVTLYAIWTSGYVLTYDFNNGSSDIATQTCTPSNIGGSCEIQIFDTIPTRDGYAFLGWADSNSATSANYTSGNIITLDNNHTLYAIWAPIYTLTYDLNGGTGEVAAETCHSTTTIGSCNLQISNTIPTRENYAFLGWDTSASANTASYIPNINITLSSDITLYAIWAPIYTLTYDLSGGTGEFAQQTCSTTTATGNCEIQIPSTIPTLEGYNFLGWATSSTALSADYFAGDTITMNSNLTLYAVWADGKIEWQQGQDYVKDSEVDLVVKIDYPMQDFLSLLVDENIVDPTYYTVDSGSTIITLNHEYVDALEPGEHTLQANYENDITALTSFTVTENGGGGGDDDDDDDGDVSDDDYVAVPNTGDNTDETTGSSAIPYFFFVLIAILFIAAPKLAKKLHRRNKFGL